MQQTDVTGRRIGAGFIDIGVVILIALLVGGIVGNEPAPGAPDSARFGALDRLLVIVLAYGYYWIAETVWQQTLGKRALGIHVVRVDGSKPTAGSVFVRTLLRLVDALPAFYLVGLVSIFATGSRRQRLGDLAAKTRVVAVGEQPSGPAGPPERPPDEDVLAQIMR